MAENLPGRPSQRWGPTLHRWSSGAEAAGSSTPSGSDGGYCSTASDCVKKQSMHLLPDAKAFILDLINFIPPLILTLWPAGEVRDQFAQHGESAQSMLGGKPAHSSCRALSIII